MDFELVIFDCDGVLIDSEPIANRVFAEQLARAGLSMSVEDIMQRFVGRTRNGCLALATELLGRALPKSFPGEWDAALFEALRQDVRPIDGVPELIQQLEVPFCVASNSTRERMRISLQASGLLAFFAGRMFSSADVLNPKPAPDLFLNAAGSMGAAPGRCAVIEDTLTGVLAGVAAGMSVFGYVGGAHSNADALQAAGARIFDDMKALPMLLSRRAQEPGAIDA
ncbi:MAG: HAD family hydrolase [Betaproteobacteria bacterium]|nr:HAD family hydrolase [Betaproteobacteria bacterium]